MPAHFIPANQRLSCTFETLQGSYRCTGRRRINYPIAPTDDIDKFEADEYHSADHDVRATVEIFFSMAGKVVGK